MLSTLAPAQRENLGPQLAERYALTEAKLPKRLYRLGDPNIRRGDKIREEMTVDYDELPGWAKVAITAAGFVTPVGLPGKALRVGAAAGAAAAAKGAAKEAVEAAAARAVAREAAGAARVSAGAARGGARGAAERGLGAVQRTAGAAGRTRGGARATVAARAAGKTAKVAGKATAKPATFAIRHPIKTAKYSALAQTPVALSQGPDKAFDDLVQTGGVVGDITRSVGGVLSDVAPGEVAENIVKDAFELPAAVVPGAYMGAAALVEAAQGDSSRLDQLWEDYKDTGLLSGIATGDAGEVLRRIKEHPLFLALEARGAQAAVGRTAGAVARRAPEGSRIREAGRTDNRKGLDLGRGITPEGREYSRDLIEKAVQVAADRRRVRKRGQSKRGIRATDRQVKNILEERGNRLVGQEEGARRHGRSAEADFGEEVAREIGKSRLPGNRHPAELDAVPFAVRGLVTERGFGADIAAYRAKLVKRGQGLRNKMKNADTRAERVRARARLKQNKAVIEQLDRAASADPAKVFAAVRRIAERRGEHDAKLGEKTGRDSQLHQARLIPAARVILGAKFRKPSTERFDRARGLLDDEAKQARAETRSADTALRNLRSQVRSTQGKLRAARARGDAAAVRRLERTLEGRKRKLAEAEAFKSRAEDRLSRTEDRILEVERARKAFKPNEARLVDKEGEPLHGERLERALRDAGVDPDLISFVSNSPTARGPGSFYRALFPDRQTLSGRATSGKAVLEGTFDATYDALVEQMVRSRGVNDALTGFDRIMGHFAIRDKGGKARTYKTWQDADDARNNRAAEGLPRNVELRPVRLAPLHANSSELQAALKEIGALDSSSYRKLEATGEALWKAATDKNGEGPYALIPEAAFKNLEAHFAAAGPLQKVVQVVNQGFKGVVLPLSPGWYAGNFIDVSMRSLFSGTGLYGRNNLLSRRFFKTLEGMDADEVKAATGLTPEELSTRLRAGLVPGGLFGHNNASMVHREARDFSGKYLGPFAHALAVVRRTPGPRQAINAWVRVRDALLNFNELAFERQAQYAILGKVLRQEARLTRGKWESALRVSDDAMADLARGLLKTENQIKYAKKIEETLGQWTANGPLARQALIDYAPFGMWARASLKYVAYTLPAKHPIKLAIGAMLANVTEEDRAALGLSPSADADDGYGFPLPANLQGSIPLPGGGVLPVQKFTSFGMFSDPTGSFFGMILPQVPLNEAQGLDWTGSKLRNEDGSLASAPQRAAAVLGAGLDTYIPFVAQAKRIAEDGPGALSPIRPITDPGLIEYLRAPKFEVTGGTTSSSAGDWVTSSSSGSGTWNTGTSSASANWNTGD